MIWFYTYNILLLPLLWIFFKALSLVNPKVREGFAGRKKVFDILSSSNLSLTSSGKKIVIHSSSLGEFQQAIPLIKELKNKNYRVICTFFSPSGYKHSVMPYEDITKIYLPFDSVRNVKTFLDFIDPGMIIMMRYDLWYNLLFEAKKRNIKLIIANARFDHKDKFWNMKLTRSFKMAMYRMIDKIFVISDEDENNYRKKLINFKGDIIRVGDSKYERVFESAKTFTKTDVLPESVYSGKKVFVVGSSWKDDEDVLLPVIDKTLFFQKDLLTILVPHEPKETKISAIESNIASNYLKIKTIRYSIISEFKDENLIIIDCIGKLAQLYSIAYFSYVGGGFRTGLHNILEPVIFKMPVFFANKAKNSDEDDLLIKSGCGFVVDNKKQFYKIFRTLLKNHNLRDEIGEKCNLVFKETLGTASKIVEILNN